MEVLLSGVWFDFWIIVARALHVDTGYRMWLVIRYSRGHSDEQHVSGSKENVEAV